MEKQKIKIGDYVSAVCHVPDCDLDECKFKGWVKELLDEDGLFLVVNGNVAGSYKEWQLTKEQRSRNNV